MIGLNETWAVKQNQFSHFLQGYSSFDCVRPKKKSAIRGSGGVTVFVKDFLINENFVHHILSDAKDYCFVL